jgi:hypothetical protein
LVEFAEGKPVKHTLLNKEKPIVFLLNSGEGDTAPGL